MPVIPNQAISFNIVPVLFLPPLKMPPQPDLPKIKAVLQLTGATTAPQLTISQL